MLIGLSGVLSCSELKEINALMKEGDFIQGKRTAGYRAKHVKNNLQLDAYSQQQEALSSLIVNALVNCKAFNELCLPKAINRPILARYTQGMSYGFHVDSAVMNQPDCLRTDVSVTVFLNDSKDYEGGELIVKTPHGDQQVKLAAGDVVLYDSSHIHAVAPVTKGERLVAVTWVQSFVRDFQKRQTLNELLTIQKTLHQHLPDDPGTDIAFKIYQDLYRMWAET